MTTPLPLFLALLAIVALLAFFVVWSRKETWMRMAAVLVLLAAIPTIAFAYVESLGFHRPVSLAWIGGKRDLHILAVKLIQDRAIYLYADDPERMEPRPLVLPFDNQLADKLAKLADKSQQDGNGGRFMWRMDPSLDVHANQFHELPVERQLPPKPTPPPAMTYEQGT